MLRDCFGSTEERSRSPPGCLGLGDSLIICAGVQFRCRTKWWLDQKELEKSKRSEVFGTTR